MKKLLLAIVLVLCSVTVKAQYTVNIDYYVGTWKYENSGTGEEFIMKLKKKHENGTGDYLVGAYSYKKNGVIVIDCLYHYSQDYANKFHYPIYATNSSYALSNVNPNYLYMFFYDFIYNYKSRCSALSIENHIYTGSGPKKMEFFLSTGEGVYGDNFPPSNFSVPEYLILTKQE